jgi:hypothetical protein
LDQRELHQEGKPRENIICCGRPRTGDMTPISATVCVSKPAVAVYHSDLEENAVPIRTRKLV